MKSETIRRINANMLDGEVGRKLNYALDGSTYTIEGDTLWMPVIVEETPLRVKLEPFLRNLAVDSIDFYQAGELVAKVPVKRLDGATQRKLKEFVKNLRFIRNNATKLQEAAESVGKPLTKLLT
jgi:hypothetical protein